MALSRRAMRTPLPVDPYATRPVPVPVRHESALPSIIMPRFAFHRCVRWSALCLVGAGGLLTGAPVDAGQAACTNSVLTSHRSVGSAGHLSVHRGLRSGVHLGVGFGSGFRHGGVHLGVHRPLVHRHGRIHHGGNHWPRRGHGFGFGHGKRYVDGYRDGLRDGRHRVDRSVSGHPRLPHLLDRPALRIQRLHQQRLHDRLRLRGLDRRAIDGDISVQLRPDARVDGSPRVLLNREPVVTRPIPQQRAGRAEWVPPVYRYQEHDGRYFRVLERSGYWR